MTDNVLATNSRSNSTLLQRERLDRLIARVTGTLGAIGFVLFVVAIFVTGSQSYQAAAGDGCTVTAGVPSGDDFKIDDVQPLVAKLNGDLCMTVDNLVSDPARQEANARVNDALDLLTQADRDVREAEDAQLKAPAAEQAIARQRVDILKSRRAERLNGLSQVRDDLLKLNAQRTLSLTINGQTIPDLTLSVPTKLKRQLIVFPLRPNADASSEAAKFWRNVLNRPVRNGTVDLQLGLTQKGQDEILAYTGKTVRLQLFDPLVMWLAGGGILLLLIGLAGLAYDTPLLRDGDTNRSTYSLSRVQMSFWLVLTVFGFLYIWLVTGQYLNVVGTGTFVLLGISGATAAVAQAVGGNRVPSVSRNFIRDISGNDEGVIQIHRVQIIAWTLVLGAIYAWNIARRFELTDFDANLLALSGIVNGVYAGLKARENSPSGTDA